MSPSVPPPTLSASIECLSGGSDVSPMLRSMKIEVPKFDGSDPNGWIFRVQEFFDFHSTSDPLRIVVFHMEGKAAAWFQRMKANELLYSWTDFLRNQSALFKLAQTSLVAEFQTAFEELIVGHD